MSELTPLVVRAPRRVLHDGLRGQRADPQADVAATPTASARASRTASASARAWSASARWRRRRSCSRACRPTTSRSARGLGEAPPLNIIVLPVLFEGEVKAVIELASFHPFSADPPALPRSAHGVIGVVLNMIGANMRTEELLQQSQCAHPGAADRSRRSSPQQQDELKRTNSELEKQALELEEKARLLAEQNTQGRGQEPRGRAGPRCRWRRRPSSSR